MRRGRAPASAAAALIVLLSLAGAAAAQAPPPLGAGRLQGQFAMAGKITVAVRIRGEQPGETVQRLWTFTPLCPVGPCRTIALVRARAAGTDSLVLHQRAPGHYAGKGRFYAPLRCAGRIWPRGERVPFTIRVKITATTVANGTVLASKIHARYINRKRVNRTPCVAIPGHDAARYTGSPVPPPSAPPPAG